MNVKCVLQKLTRNKHKQNNIISSGENNIMYSSDGELREFK